MNNPRKTEFNSYSNYIYLLYGQTLEIISPNMRIKPKKPPKELCQKL